MTTPQVTAIATGTKGDSQMRRRTGGGCRMADSSMIDFPDADVRSKSVQVRGEAIVPAHRQKSN
jgi:hypothetical protein